MTPASTSLRRAGQLAAGLVVGAVAFEVAARLEDLVRYRMPLAAPYASEQDLAVHDSLGIHGRPNAQYLKWSLNSLGTRGPEVPEQRAAGVLRVVTAGASETFGQSESPGREYPRQLEDSLRRRIASDELSFRSVEVLNSAFFGMTLPTSTQDVRLRLARLRPQIVVLYPTTVQYLAEALPAAPVPVAVPTPVLGLWERLRPRAFIRLREELKRVAPVAWREELWSMDLRRKLASRQPGWRYSTVPPDRVAAFEADLRAFVGTVRKAGAEPVLTTHGNRFVGGADRDSSLLGAWERFYPRAEGQVILAFDSVSVSVVRRVAADSGVVVADVRAALSRCPECFADYAHFTDEGAARTATAVAEAVAQVISRRPEPPQGAVVQALR